MTNALVLASLLAASPVSVPKPLVESERRRVEMIQRVQPAVVAVLSASGGGGGSGVLISNEGYALTNFHVVAGMGPAMKCGLSDGTLYDAVLVGLDPVGDVALIKLLGEDDFPGAPLGDSDTLRVGDTVLAMGNPFLLATDFAPTVTMGIVSGLHRYQHPSRSEDRSLLEYTDCIQTDASINPGNSGGPLFNLRGELVGINGRISLEKRGRVNVGVGYAISINQIKNFMDHLKGGLVVDHASLGATVVTDSQGRVVVSDILESSDAFRQGLRVDDELVTFAGRPLRSANDFQNVLGVFPKGWRVDLVYRRDEQRHRIVTRLQGKHREGQLTETKAPQQQPPGQPPSLKRPEEKIPESVRRLFEKKPGFANYYFNQLHRDRLLDGWRRRSDYSSSPGQWTLQLNGADGEQSVAKMNDQLVAWTSGDDVYVYKYGEEAESPPGADGLLVALDHWRRFLIDQTKWFSEVRYAGGVPVGGVRHEVVSARRGGATLRFLFDDEGRLSRLEHSLTPDAAPVEVAFGDYRTVNGRLAPGSLAVVGNNGAQARFEVTKLEASP